MRNASRLLEVQTIGGVETLVVAGYNRADDESLASSTSSGGMMPRGFGMDSRTGSPRQVPQMSLVDNRSNGNTPNSSLGEAGRWAAGSSEALLPRMTPMALGQTGLMECRIRRLEVGRRRAEQARRVASSLRVARVAKEQRTMLLTCDAEALASSKSSYEALLLTTQGAAQGSPEDGPSPTAAGLGKVHILALRRRVVLELSAGGESQRRRGSVQDIVDTIRRGSTQLRRGSVQLITEARERTLKRPVSERTLKRPVSHAENGHRNDECEPSPHTGADVKKGAEENEHEAGVKGDGVALLSPPDEKDDAGAPVLSIGSKQDEPRGEKKEDVLSGKAGGAGVNERKPLAPQAASPQNGTSTEQQPLPQQKRQRPVTPPQRETGLEEGEDPSAALEGMLAAVAGLSQKVEQEGGPMGATAYAAWWLGAVSEAELELKKRFLTPGPRGSLWSEEPGDHK